MISGKTLGGSTSINGGAWTRGLNAQYDALSSLLEDSEQSVGWNWDSLFEYMKKVRGSLWARAFGFSRRHAERYVYSRLNV